DLALSLLDRGQAQAAGAVAADIVAPETVLDMLIDRRFDAITTAAADRYDLGKVAVRRLAALRAASAAAPDKLKGFNAIVSALLSEGRPGEALALIDDAIKRARPADGAHSTFTDLDELNWAYDLRSRALLLLGRGDEALASMKAGAERTENGQSNVSQQLNLGELYVHLDRPAEALDAIKTVSPDKVSAYGRMDREGVRAEAFAQLHDRAGLAASLAYMKAHADEAPAWLIEVSIETGDTEGAAQTTIRMLADPIQRPQALELVQDAIVPDTAPDYLKRFHQGIAALRERPDVKAAIDRVGRVMVVPLMTNQL
ncbi:MAG: hypothetical protein P4L73_19570, partial [Caulobacteraceae bacterium]|nr:hypothetical protein [Caulobacteraceae bacterium]